MKDNVIVSIAVDGHDVKQIVIRPSKKDSYHELYCDWMMKLGDHQHKLRVTGVVALENLEREEESHPPTRLERSMTPLACSCKVKTPKGLTWNFRPVKKTVTRDPDCPLHGDNSTISGTLDSCQCSCHYVREDDDSITVISPNKGIGDSHCPVCEPSKADPLEEQVTKAPMFNDLICEKCESKIGPFPSKPYLCKKCKAKASK